MHLETLKLYCNVIQRQNFSRGAADSGVTQSAASQAIRQLEEELGVILLDRSKRPFAITTEGEKFYKACRELLEGFERIRGEIANDKRLISGTVRVAAIYSVGLHDMGIQMERFRTLFPRARVRLECLHPEKVVRSVIEDTADVGILSYPPANRALNVIRLRDEPMRFVSRPSHRLSRRKRVKAKDLAGEPFVAFDADLSIRKAIDRALRQHNLIPDVVMEFDNIESIKRAVSNGAGISILPEAAIQKEVAIRDLASAALDLDDLTRPIALIHRRQKHLSQEVSHFIEMLQTG
ncbi:MAG: LysR family transcriptional regulator [Nitrospinota bacterium]|nr:LysR family transcriptional regulator [Nitrospinota bacterium]